MKRLLITGASGFLGWQISKNKPAGWHIIGSYFKNKNGIFPKTDSLPLDLTDKDAIWHALKETKADAVFHLAAHSGTTYCEKHPEESYQLNVTATSHLAEMCADRKVKLIFTSSEQVFDGEKGQYTEKDEPNPRNEYGKQKLQAEEAVQQIYPEAAIVRISVLFGKGSEVAQSFFNQWIDGWRNMLPVTAFHDEVRSFLSGDAASDGLLKLLDQDAIGIFHLGGADALSRYEFAQLARDGFQFQHAIIKSLSQKDVKLEAYRPADLSLNCGKIAGIGYHPRRVRDELMALKNQIHIDPSTSLN